VVRGKIHHDNQLLKNDSNFLRRFYFLCYNRYLWDEKTVQEALLAVKDDQKMDRLEKIMQELRAGEQNEDHKEDEDMDKSD
jgi:hypothetical protein